MLFFPVTVFFYWQYYAIMGIKKKKRQLFLWHDAEVANNLKGFKIQRYNPPCSGVWLGGKEWGQWDRVSWHCQSSAWQKTCSQTIAGILNRRLKVSILLSVSGRCAFDWWGLRRGAFRLMLVWFCLFPPVDYGLILSGLPGDTPNLFFRLPNDSPIVIVWNVCME